MPFNDAYRDKYFKAKVTIAQSPYGICAQSTI